MKKLLRPIDILLLATAGVVDIFEFIRDPFGIGAESAKLIYGFVPTKYKKHHVAHLVWRTLQTGNIERVSKHGAVYLRITSAGEASLKRDFPLLQLAQRRWDGKWRFVFFDIAEVSRTQRDNLRAKLKELGFGMVQRSVWVTPHDILADFREFISSNKLDDDVFLMETRHFISGNPRQLATRLWQLDKLNKRYEKLYKKVIVFSSHDREKKIQQGLLVRKGFLSRNGQLSSRESSASSESLLRRLTSGYLEILITDPFLPQELLPRGWLREKVEKEIKRLVRKIK